MKKYKVKLYVETEVMAKDRTEAVKLADRAAIRRITGVRAWTGVMYVNVDPNGVDGKTHV